MAKLTRYDSFEELKSALAENPLTPAECDRVYAELEQFILIMRESLPSKKSKEKELLQNHR